MLALCAVALNCMCVPMACTEGAPPTQDACSEGSCRGEAGEPCSAVRSLLQEQPEESERREETALVLQWHTELFRTVLLVHLDVVLCG